jgi:hypothetical protein
MRLLHLALVAPEAREAFGGAEFQGFGLLLGATSSARSKYIWAFAASRSGERSAISPAMRCTSASHRLSLVVSTASIA